MIGAQTRDEAQSVNMLLASIMKLICKQCCISFIKLYDVGVATLNIDNNDNSHGSTLLEKREDHNYFLAHVFS